MTYIENIFLCLALPLILSMFFIKGRVRRYALFLTVGMAVCLLSAYVSSFFMGQYGVDGTVAAIEITPVCEEVIHRWRLQLPQCGGSHRHRRWFCYL